MADDSDPDTELLPVHPSPGARPARSIWVGEDGPAPVEVTNADVRPFSHGNGTQFSEVASTYQARHLIETTSKKPKSQANSHRSQTRLLGVDVARGMAFLGMVIIHILPGYDENSGSPTPIWTIFSGNAAALFALLAGVSLAFMTGGRSPYTGAKRIRALVSIATRSLILLAIGMTINLVGEASGVLNILPYYGLMFFIAIPLTLFRVRWLILIAFIFASVGPFLVFSAYDLVGDPFTGNPTILDLFTRPSEVFTILTFTGAYPIVTWALYLCVGIALGRLSLHRERTQVAMVIVGTVIAVFSKITSFILLARQGGREAIFDATEDLALADFRDLQIFGPESYYPTTTYWWLAVDAPHSNTPFAMTFSLGVAMAVLGLVLLLSKYLMNWLAFFANMGSMSLTLYAMHLILVGIVDVTPHPTFWFIAQVVFAVAFAVIWALTVGPGPLEKLVSRASKAVGSAFIPERTRPQKAAQDH